MNIEVHGSKKPDFGNAGHKYAFAVDLARTRTPWIVVAVIGSVVAFFQNLMLGQGINKLQPEPFSSNDGRGATTAEPELAPDLFDTQQHDTDEAHDNISPASIGFPKFSNYFDHWPASAFYPIHTAPIDMDVRPLVIWPANDRDGGFYFGPQQWSSAKGTAPMPGKAKTPLSSQEPEQNTPGPHQDAEQTDDEDENDPNRSPRTAGPVYLLDISVYASLLIMLNQLLDRAYDPDGDILTVVGLSASNGSLTLREDGGAWLYRPTELGPTTLTYTISDGEFSVHQTASFMVVKALPVFGTHAVDMMTGGIWGDELHGLDGDDVIDGREGGDTILGGDGNDRIFGGLGVDVLFGGNGDDVIFGGSGNDIIWGGAGNDRLYGEDGDDRIFGEDGDDHILGGGGNDILDGGVGHDYIDGGDGDDIIEGGHGDDVIIDGHGADKVWGGEGNDRVLATPDGVDDYFDGGPGCDTIDYSQATQGIVFDLVTGEACSLEIGKDTIIGFEKVVGGQGADHFVVGNAPVTMAGGEGENVFEFVGGSQEAPSAPVLHAIVDFKKGDVISMSKYKIFNKVFDELEDDFERIYGQNIEEESVSIRYLYESSNDEDKTIIEADLNGDDTFETSIILSGRHALVIMEQIA